MIFSRSLAATAALLLVTSPSVLGHGNIVEPAAQWKAGWPQTGFSSEITVDSLWGKVDGSTFGYGGEGAIKYWDANFPKSSYKSLKEVILAKQTNLQPNIASAECGYTIKNDAKRSPLTSSVKHTSFFHPGPCEVWCGNTKLAYSSDCQTTYKSGTIDIDASKCKGADQLTLYWLAVHGNPWQVYIYCVWLTGSSGASPAIAPSPASPPAAPAVTTRAPTPAATTRAPATTTRAPAPLTPSPVANDATPAPKPPAVTPSQPKPTPSAPSKNCQRRARV